VNGPEHYREAERLLERVENPPTIVSLDAKHISEDMATQIKAKVAEAFDGAVFVKSSDIHVAPNASATLAAAQVHATLAHAAATAETPEYYVGGGWARVLEDDQ
jgi:hypothetical protein